MMSKIKKIMFTTCISLVLLLPILVYCAEKILSTRVTKDIMVQKIQEATGYNVEITGDLLWHYTIKPQLDIEKITFSQQGKTIIQLSKVSIGIALLPLLQQGIAVSIHFQQWQQNQLLFSNGSAHLSYENNILTLTNFHADFYQGQIKGNALINLDEKIPRFDIHLNTIQTDISDLLDDLTDHQSISGKMDMQANLSSIGTNTQDFIKNLNGNVDAIIKNGKLNTIDIGSVIPYIASATNKKQYDFFDSLALNNVVTAGIANTKIALLATSYHANGKGKINLNTQHINIKLDAYYTQSQETKNIAIPIHIDGILASPSIGIDLATPLNQLLTTNKNQINKKLNQLLSNL